MKIMNIPKRLIFLLITLPLMFEISAKEELNILECLYEDDSLACAKKIADIDLDSIESQIAGGNTTNVNVTMSKIIEESGRFIADGAHAYFYNDAEEESRELDDNTGNREARKRFGKKKKKKLLRRLIPLAMLFKAKISLLLQLISTHFQFKFFAVAIISLLINIARFWLDLKKSHTPERVIYYETAQHQHHYEPEDEHGYWKRRSLDNSPYTAWTPISQ